MTGKKILLITFVSLFALNLLFGFGVLTASTQEEVKPPFTSEEEKRAGEKGGLFKYVSDVCYVRGDCSLCDIMTVFVAVANIILTSLGGIAVIVFMWGTFGLVMARGNTEAIQANKKVIRGVIVGILIVLLAWQLVGAAMGVLLKSTGGSNITSVISPANWFNVGGLCK